MTVLAAAALGYRSVVLTPDADSPASQVASLTIVAAYQDEAALTKFAAAADVVTLEFENVPAEALEFLSSLAKPVRPGAGVLAVSQDRLREKDFFVSAGAQTASYRQVSGLDDISTALAELRFPLVLKTRRMGYDGRGQVHLAAAADAERGWRTLGGSPAIIEQWVEFEREISVIVARGIGGETEAYVAVENRHRDGILDTTLAPAGIAHGLREQARELACRFAADLELVGLLAVEMFVTRDGTLLVNEMAPRPHNSGHWTIDACLCSQFEQHVRAICGLPLGSPERHSDAVMTNLLGLDANDWRRYLGERGVRLHLYGKTDAREGRKMGHVTRLLPKSAG
jgi:5-(carboxyamino)imidazole ribonucleotide synthase